MQKPFRKCRSVAKHDIARWRPIGVFAIPGGLRFEQSQVHRHLIGLERLVVFNATIQKGHSLPAMAKTHEARAPGEAPQPRNDCRMIIDPLECEVALLNIRRWIPQPNSVGIREYDAIAGAHDQKPRDGKFKRMIMP